MSEPKVHMVQIRLCELCLNGEGRECHTPGCALWLHDSPGFPIMPELYEIIEPAALSAPAATKPHGLAPEEG